MKQHKWYNENVAWASGAEIESDGGCGWFRDASPEWDDDDYEFRIKPPPQHCCCDKQTCSALKEPQYLYVYESDISAIFELSKSKTDTEDWTYVGKIKLEE